MNLSKKLKQYIEDNLIVEDFLCDSVMVSFERTCVKKASLPNYLEKEKEENSFSSLLFSYIDSKNLKDSDIYHKANIDRRLFSKIRSNDSYHPKKETVIALGLALELSIQDLERLLQTASYSLPKNNVFDLIIRFCVQERIYDLFEVNSLLSEYQCPLLRSIEKDD